MSTSSKDVIGISKRGAQAIKTAVSEYRNYLDERFAYWIATNGGAAIKGEESKKNFKKMTELFASDNSKYIAYLAQFENKLNDILKHYASQDASNTTFTSSAKSTLEG